ncbi:PRC-barrel domain-containing protein [Hyphomonas sp. WL0036]|uniref:PRC-barrel domain-containing protein n=1 Tax=Hyphomonas sediminis TaxID=2866160 RepID=UPI001C7F7050|nr:PRC-barrel domain-containing protein [Hyphomonas sediminis]MBY9066672.1 PRC-barrel domain-containing protein [Hyphomonas sediminis]
MKTLFATASAAALMLGAAACSDTSQSIETAGYETSGPQVEEVADLEDPTAQTAEATGDRVEYTLASGELEASDLIGASVHNPAGEEIATVADVFLGTEGMQPVILIRDGGVSGLGGDLRTLAFEAASVTPGEVGDEPDLIVAMSEDSLETLPEFEQEEMNDYRLASEMMGAVPALSFSGDMVRVNDLILTEGGELRYAVISPGLATTEQVVINANAIKVAEGDSDGELVVDIDQAELDEAPMYRWE